MNIRGHDNPNSPIPNCRLIIDSNKEIFLVCDKIKAQNLIKEKKIKKKNLILPNDFKSLIKKLKKNRIIIDERSCSLFYENILKKRFIIANKVDPIYLMKSIKNKVEIDNMINSHIFDGIALTKFLYWIKNKNKKEINEYQAQSKLENFRKKIKIIYIQVLILLLVQEKMELSYIIKQIKLNQKKLKRMIFFYVTQVDSIVMEQRT